MYLKTRPFLLISLLIAALLNGLLLLPLPHLVQAIAVYFLTGFLPGFLLVDALVGQSGAAPTRWERLLYAAGAGYGVMVVGMTLLSFLPGPLLWWQTLLAFDGIIVLLLALIAVQARRRPLYPRPTPALFPELDPDRATRTWIWIGALTLLLVAGFLRFTNLGYAEYQGDEARATLRAAAIIQGADDVLLIHKKGPTEIVVPAVAYSLTGHLTETTARWPFAVANVVALFTLFLLGWRLAGPLVGWTAAMFLAVDGYFIGYSHIVQYQSIVFLCSALAVLIFYRLTVNAAAVGRYLTLAAVILATGLLSHYEAALAVIPALFLLLVLFWQRPTRWREFLGDLVPPILTGGVMLALFYIPFVRHPHFRATYTYLTDRRVGGSFPYNNLADFFLRTTVYSTTYYVLLLIAATLAALYFAYRQGWGRRWAAGLSLAATGVMILTFINPTWLRFGETDLIVLPFAFFIVLAVLTPRLKPGERMLWLWFGFGMLLALFFVEKPRTHVYTFFTPWVLLAAWALVRIWRGLREQIGAPAARIGGAIAATALIALFGVYAYWYFVSNTPEVLRTWDAWHPQGYWVAYDEPDDKALFGFPLANGWKVAGVLYEEGVIAGDYETNEKEAWVPSWYTRGQIRCGRTADWFFEIDNLEPWNNGDQLAMEHYLRDGFSKWGIVEINDTDQMVIYRRTGESSEFPTQEPVDDVPRYDLADFTARFDELAGPDFPLTYPAVNQLIENPIHTNFDDLIWLEGYNIDYPQPLRQGDTITLTLFWRAQKPVDASYKVFNQAYYGDSGMIAQLDGYPVCESRETWRWDPGELITDRYEIPVADDAPDGLYPLYTGLYIEQTLERLNVLDESGNTVGAQVQLTDIRVGEE
ncbi:MAG: glycosyltransferase family 39 protein [Caldilineaceae bacterium]|nr:glycosyltransferase family 39 protein [Caldilineaceae bacterium]